MVYRHNKTGNLYRVLIDEEVKHTERYEDLVIYQRVEGGTVYARPYDMFHEEVVVNGEIVPRFEKVSDYGLK